MNLFIPFVLATSMLIGGYPDQPAAKPRNGAESRKTQEGEPDALSGSMSLGKLDKLLWDAGFKARAFHDIRGCFKKNYDHRGQEILASDRLMGYLISVPFGGDCETKLTVLCVAHRDGTLGFFVPLVKVSNQRGFGNEIILDILGESAAVYPARVTYDWVMESLCLNQSVDGRTLTPAGLKSQLGLLARRCDRLLGATKTPGTLQAAINSMKSYLDP